MALHMQTEVAGAVEIDRFLARLVKLKGSDLHLTAGLPPVMRIDGVLRPLEGVPAVPATSIRETIYSILTQAQRERFEQDWELDIAYSVRGTGRFRVNVLMQRSTIGAVFRVIPFDIPALEELGLPDAVRALADIPKGLVLVTGATGSGKSTTLASIIDVINREQRKHIVTIEDPIEFLHHHKGCVVDQRQVGTDTRSFAIALRQVLRQDPDVILVGEMRDTETVSAAITAAETGHLVLATLHTQDAPQSIDRIIDVFQPHQQAQIRTQLSSTLQAVLSQQLLPRADKPGRVVATEILLATPAVRNVIRESKTHQLFSLMQAGGQFGMRTMDASLAELANTGKITREAALAVSSSPKDLDAMMKGSSRVRNI